MPDREVTYVDTANPLWAAMVFLAVLAYPEDYGRRDRAILAMKALMCRAAKRLGLPSDRNESELFARMPPQQQRGTLRRLSGRLYKRQQAGVAASYLLLGVRKPGHRKPITPAAQQKTVFSLLSRGATYAQARKMVMRHTLMPGPPLSLNDFAKRYSGGPARFKSDAWRPEILHLILAFHSVRISWKDPHGFSVVRLLANPEWSLKALRVAEMNAALLPRTSNLPSSLRAVRTTPLIRLISVLNETLENSEPG
jgi:hypothetical protein